MSRGSTVPALSLPKGSSHGFTLVELLLGVVLTSIISLALGPLLVQGVNSYVLATTRSQITNDTRQALYRMGREIMLVRTPDIRLIQQNRFTFVDAQGGPADFGLVAAGARGTIYRTGTPVLKNVNNLTFTYLDANGNQTAVINRIRRIDVEITANNGIATVTLRTEIFPRRFMYTNFN